MPITRINKLTDGLNELANPQNLPDGGLQESVNYEMLGDGKLTRRKDPAEYGDHVRRDSLKTVLTGGVTPIFTQSILQISPPYYPVKKLSDMTGDFLILLFGVVASGDYELYMTYENDSYTWTATKVDITGITYDSNTYLEFFIGDDKLIITDTYNETTNFPHYVKIDAEGELITGLFSIKSPTNKPTLLPTTEYNSEQFEEDADDVHLDDCGIVQCVYTVITKEGDESNPSPMSNSRMMQFFKKDTTDFNDIRWIDNFRITNLSVPVLTGDLTEQLKYFNVYFRVIRYSEGEAAEPFYFSQRFEILDKESNEGATGNGYLITVPQDLSILLSYENDIAPYAKHAAEVSSITGFANIREKMRFPFNFEKYAAIEINNINNKNFVDAIVQIRIYDGNNTGTLDHNDVQVDMIADLDLSFYDKSGADEMKNLNLIRIYDDDLTTPIKVVYNKYNGAPFLDVFVKVPLLTAGQIKFLYLCFNTEDAAETDLGVTTAEYQTTEYGQFTLKSESTMVALLDTERVKSSKTIICSPFDYQDKSTEILNLADDNNPGEIIGTLGEFVERQTKQLSRLYSVGAGAMKHMGTEDQGIEFTEVRYSGLPFTLMPNKVTMWGRIEYYNIDQAEEKAIYMFRNDPGTDDRAIYLSIMKTGEDEYRWALFSSTSVDVGGNLRKIVFDNIPITNNATGHVFIALSIENGEQVSLFVGNLTNRSFYTQKVLWEEWTVAPPNFMDDPEKDFLSDIGYFSIGNNGHGVGEGYRDFYFYHTQFQLIINKYYDGANSNDVSAMWNLASFLPTYEMPLGTKIELAIIE